MAMEGPSERVREVFFEAQYSNAANLALTSVLSSSVKQSCDFFGFSFQCTRKYLSPKEWRFIKRTAASRAKSAYAALARDKETRPHDRLSITNAIQRVDRGTVKDDDAFEPIFALPPYFGYIPFAAYDGALSAGYEKINQSFLNDREGTTQADPDSAHEDWIKGRDVYDFSKSDRRTFRLQSDFDFKQLFTKLSKHTFDVFGHDVFGDFAEVGQIEQGQAIAKFWSEYANYSEAADLTSCSDGCTVAVRLNASTYGITSIAVCKVTSINGIVGSPEDCYTVLTSKADKIYIRATIFINAIGGLDGVGGDEISCSVSKHDYTQQKLALDIADAFRKLENKAQGVSYQVEERPRGKNLEILVADRFGVSEFFKERTTYEISTIRILIYEDDSDTIEINVAITAAVSRRNSQSQADFTTVSDAQSASMRSQIQKLLPSKLKCKVSRST
jgi:hypothetical protein